MSDCLFCKIIKGEIPGKFIYRDKTFVAFYDINPKAPIHALVVPVKHFESLREAQEEDRMLLGELMLAIQKIALNLKIAKDGYKVVINNGSSSGQIIFHMHIHLLGGWKTTSHWEV